MMSIRQLLNKLFGFEYVTYMYGSSMSVGRVKFMGDLYYVYLCCTGYVPINTIGVTSHPITMTSKDVKRMIDHNTKIIEELN